MLRNGPSTGRPAHSLFFFLDKLSGILCAAVENFGSFLPQFRPQKSLFFRFFWLYSTGIVCQNIIIKSRGLPVKVFDLSYVSEFDKVPLHCQIWQITHVHDWQKWKISCSECLGRCIILKKVRGVNQNVIEFCIYWQLKFMQCIFKLTKLNFHHKNHLFILIK